HTLMHHQFFTAEEPRFADHKDWRVTIFPPFTLVFFTLTTLPFPRHRPSATARLCSRRDLLRLPTHHKETT
ncbi:MAG: hypothetical protein AB7H19_13670, partial [Porticoccaceae bacterium]